MRNAGYVYNDFSGMADDGAQYNILHTAMCDTLLGAKASVRKYNFGELAEAIAWLKENRGEERQAWRRCGVCQPYS